jgi:hypothetical protein
MHQRTGKRYDQNFRDRWHQLHNDGDVADFQIICQGHVRWVHQSVLARSNEDYFQALFNLEWKESTQRSITVPSEISPGSTSNLLIFLYTGEIYDEASHEHIFELLELSDYFQCPVMHEAIVLEIKASISLNNVQGFVEQWSRHKSDGAADILARFIADYFQELSTRKFPFQQLGEMVNKVWN